MSEITTRCHCEECGRIFEGSDAELDEWIASHECNGRPQPLITALDSNRVSVLLSCGHRSVMHSASSVFDFPEDEDWCSVCDAPGKLDSRLVAALVEARQS